MTTRILIVEDEESLAIMLRYNLEKEGFAVETTAHGDEADLRIKENPPDLAVIDWMLPGLSGIDWSGACACGQKQNNCRSSC
jgi:two-component system phosphate regulon response regulator PhoB